MESTLSIDKTVMICIKSASLGIRALSDSIIHVECQKKNSVFIIYELSKGHEISVVCESCVKNATVRKISKDRLHLMYISLQ